MGEDNDLLRAPLTLPCGQVLPNRIAKAAMTEGLADAFGRPSPELLRLYEKWSASGCALLVTGNVQIDRYHLERPGNVIVEGAGDAALKRSLAEWARIGKAGGARFWVQLSHAGRQTLAIVNPRPKAPSALNLAIPGKQFGRPVALTEPEIRELIERHATAAAVVQEAGFDGVEIHAAHGYLLSTFLSPRANARPDLWGGSLEHRARMLLEVVRAVRARVGKAFAVGVKLNSADFQKGGFHVGESRKVVQWLEAEGVDLIEISGGNYEQPRMLQTAGVTAIDPAGLAPSTAAREAYFAGFAAEMRNLVKVPLMVTGGFRTAAAMQRAIREDNISMIGVARPLCVDFDCVNDLLAGRRDVLDSWEKTLQIGPGQLGPRSNSTMVKMLNGYGASFWCYQQFRRVGRGEAPSTELSVAGSLVREAIEQRKWLWSSRRAGAR